MAENRTLLSQAEIDALVSFLQDNNQVSSIGDVLDQSGIDKLIEIIQFNNNHGVFLNADTNTNILGIKKADICSERGEALDNRACELEYVITESGMAEIYCNDTPTGQRVKIYPECLLERKYVSEGSDWGKAVSPRHFNKVANLFRIDFSKETFERVTSRFAEVMYGDASAKISGIYFPPEE